MGTASRIFMILVPLAFFFLVMVILFGGEGMFDKVKHVVLGAKEVLPEVSVGLKEQKADVTIPDVQREEILDLKKTIVFMLSGKGRGVTRENCFASYGGFSALGEEGPSVTLELRGDKTVLTAFGGSGGKQVITDLSADFPGMKPCVIAGKGGMSERFFTHFIEGKELYYPYFTAVSSLKIFGGSSSYNIISVPEINFQNNFEDGGWLFTPDGEHVCFFPTNSVADYDDDGIDNDYFASDEEDSIPNRIKQEKLQQCD